MNDCVGEPSRGPGDALGDLTISGEPSRAQCEVGLEEIALSGDHPHPRARAAAPGLPVRRVPRAALRVGSSRPGVVVALLGVGLSACAGGEVATVSGTVRDSAGIRVIDLPAPDPSTPRLELPLDRGWAPAPGHEFGELVDVEPLETGGVALLDRFDAQVLVLDPDGRVVSRFGREGSGPGEFGPRGLTRIVATGGALVVPDLVQQRLSEFTPDGRLLDTRPFPGGGGYAVDWRRGPDGGLAYRVLDPEGDRILVSADDRLDTLRVFPPVEGETNLLLPPVPLWDLRDGRLVLGSSGAAGIELRETGSGDLLWRARRGGTLPPLTESDRAALEEILIASVTPDGGGATLDAASRAALLEQVDFPTVRPVLSAVFLTPDGEIWIRLAIGVEDMGREALRVGSAEGYGGPEWDVLGSDGVLRRRVRVPAGFNPRAFVGSWLYGIVEDATGVTRPARVAVPVSAPS